MRAGYGEKTRGFFAKNTNPKYLVDFAGVKIFDNATVDTNILIFSKEDNEHQTKCAVTDKLNKDSLKDLSNFVQQQHSICSFSNEDSWVILSPIEQSIKRKIESVGTPLKDWDIQIYRGVLTGYNDAFIITTEKRDEILANCITEEEKQKTAELIRPILRGRDIKRYGYNWADLHLIATFPSRHYNIDDYPAVKAYLLSFGRERLEQTGKKYMIDGEEVKARKKTNNKWFETQDSISYWEDFNKPKIVWASVGAIEYSHIPKGYLLLDTNYFFAIQSSMELLAILNSKLLHWWIAKEDTPIGTGGAYRHYKYNLERISIPAISQEIKRRLQELVIFIDSNNEQDKLELYETEVNKIVYNIYLLTDEEIKEIERN
jgi:hypothetical protein